MNLQDVANIAIPEGDVRTIHDNNSRLLWGRLSYDTKYDGDSTQQTYTGKNLSPVEPGTYVSADLTYAISADGTVTINGTSTAVSARAMTATFPINLTAGQAYTISASNPVASNDILVRLIDGNGNAFSGSVIALTSINKYATFTPTSDSSPLRVQIRINSGVSLTNFVVKPMVEKGSSPSVFEPYVGGVPAPNPSYPQDVNVVTGMQTISITDGIDSHSYTVNLGSTELCKIGTYQDYIYKSGSDWYVHKETGKTVLTGDEPDWSSTALTTGRRYYLLSNDLGLPNRDGTTGDMVSDNFINIDYATYYSVGGVDGISFSYFNTNHYVQVFFQTAFASVNAFKTWLGTHNTTVYYALATPTDTKITDATLIAQFDAVHQFLTRYGYNGAVSGNLPIIIDRTSL